MTAKATAGWAGSSKKAADLSHWNNLEILKNNKLKMKQIPSNEPPQTGDILLWAKGTAAHIGIIGEIRTGERIFLHSSGSFKYTLKNLLSRSGPTSTSYDIAKGHPTVFSGYGKEQYRLRLVPDIEGDWKFHLRCDKQNRDAVTFEFHLSEEESKDDVIKITSNIAHGVDYNGKPFTARAEGSYFLASNQIELIITYTFQSQTPRSDKFTDYLDTSTAYKLLEKVVDNDGCLAAGKLEAVTSADVVSADKDSSVPAIGKPDDISECGLGYCPDDEE
jgi:hypothetical protein